MRDRAALILKIICVGLAAWVAWELVKAGRDVNPLAHLTMPDVPSLPADTNAPPPALAGKPSVKPGTNGMAVAGNTNAPGVASNTNGPAAAGNTNWLATGANTNRPVAAMTGETNAVPRKRVRRGDTNATAVAAASASTNLAATTNVADITNSVMPPATNGGITIVKEGTSPISAAPIASIGSPTNASGSNVAMNLPTNAIVSGTNIRMAKMSGANAMADSAGTNLPNVAMARARGARSPNAAMAAMMGGPGGRMSAAPLAPEIQARVDRVYESEIFAPVMHPMPMALLGVAGKAAFLRAPSGQTGMVKEGENLGDVKLLKVGINRVLVEQDGKQQELMIFAGLGGESLLTKTNESSNETTKN